MNKNLEVLRVSGIYQTPTGSHATEATRTVWDTESRVWSPNCFFAVIRLLMLAGFCLLFSVAVGGEITVEVIQPFEVVVEQPAVVPSQSESEISLNDYSLVLCTAKWCGPCQVFKRSPEYLKLTKAMPVEIADIDKYPAWRPYAARLPTVWLIRRSDRGMLHSWRGVVTLPMVRQEVVRQTSRQGRLE